MTKYGIRAKFDQIEIDFPNTIFINSNVLACTERRNKNEAPDPVEGSCEQ